MGVEGEESEKREKERETDTDTDTEPRHITHTTHTHLPFLPPSAVFLMIPDNLRIAFGQSCQCLYCNYVIIWPK